MGVRLGVETTARKKHARLRSAMSSAEQALEEWESGRRSSERMPQLPPPDPRNRGRRELEEELRPRTYSPRHLREAWDEFREMLRSHLDREQATVRRIVDQLVEGTADRADVTADIWDLVAEHKRLFKQSRRLRRAVLVAEPAREEFTDLLDRFDEHSRFEDLELYPALLDRVGSGSGLPEDSYLGLYKASEDITDTLRQALADERDASDPDRPGLLDRLKALLGVGSR